MDDIGGAVNEVADEVGGLGDEDSALDGFGINFRSDEVDLVQFMRRFRLAFVDGDFVLGD